MCRNNRRCKVSKHQNEVANAKRRIKYHAQKEGNNNGNTNSTGENRLLVPAGLVDGTQRRGTAEDRGNLARPHDSNGPGLKSSLAVTAGGKSSNAKIVGSFEAPAKRAAELRAAGKTTPVLHQLDPADSHLFYDKITDLQNDNPWHASVYVYPQEEYKDMRVFLTDDGESGIAMKADGDIVSVFSSAIAKDKQSANSMISTMVSLGGKKLDCFDTVLPRIYAQEGFVEVGRDSWNDEYKPDGWEYSQYEKFNNGKPDVVYMEYKAPE